MGSINADAQRQIKHMIAFIEQEANEKIEEIDAKSEEEFSIEKGRLIQQNRQKITDLYDKKEEQVELQRRIQLANTQNKARLRLLKAREDQIIAVLNECRKRLGNITKNTKAYKNILEKLIIQGLFQLMESNVLVRCREDDEKLVKDVLENCKKESEDKLDIQLDIVLDDTYLPEDTKGGVELYAQEGHIKVPNTLESRLELISQQLLPEIRVALFGENTNRKFKD